MGRIQSDSIIVAPSILSANFSELADDCKRVLEAGADILHVDIMDNHFVPNLTFGTCVVNSLHKSLPEAFLDCHLMVTDPESLVIPLAKAGASLITFHIEANVSDPLALVSKIHEAGMMAGVSIKPKTPVSALSDELLRTVDMVLVMTVEPGFGGQSFMPDCAAKSAELRRRRPSVIVEVDGGIAPATVSQATSQGANVLVAGSAIFGVSDYAARINEIRANGESAFRISL